MSLLTEYLESGVGWWGDMAVGSGFLLGKYAVLLDNLAIKTVTHKKNGDN